MNLKRSIFFAVTVLAFATVVPSAHATIALSLSSTGVIGPLATIYVTDGGVGDGCAAADCVRWEGDIGDFKLIVDTGTDKTAVTTPNLMHLNVVVNNYTGAGTETLTVALSDNGFIPGVGGINTRVGGAIGPSAGSSFTSTAYFDPTNDAALFQTGAGTTALGTFTGGPGGFSGNLSAATGSLASPYGLSIVTASTLTPGSTFSSDVVLDPVPEPSSVALLGGILLASATAIRRKMRRA